MVFIIFGETGRLYNDPGDDDQDPVTRVPEETPGFHQVSEVKRRHQGIYGTLSFPPQSDSLCW